MSSKIYSALKVLGFIAGAAMLQACFFGGGHRYYDDPEPYAYSPGPPVYAYGPAPAYGYAAPPVIGDYDGHHRWHDRDWWVHNDRSWVTQHHRNWIGHERAEHEEHEHH